MTYTNKGDGSPAGAAAQQHNATALDSTSVVYGVLALDITDVSMFPSVPSGVRVRVYLGRERWVDASTLQQLAYVTWPAGRIEVEGYHPSGIEDVVRYLNRTRASQGAAEVAHAEYMARWGLGGVA